MIILGIDPGSSTTGYAVIGSTKNKPLKIIDFGCIVINKDLSESEKLKEIYKNITKLIKKYNPHIISIEKLFFFKNLKTAIPVSQTRGVIILAATLNKKKILEFTPLQVKTTITGYGRAGKKQVQKMIKNFFNLNLNEFNLKKRYRSKDDAFDALAIALCSLLISKTRGV